MNERRIAVWLLALALAMPLYARADSDRRDGDRPHGPEGPRLFLVLRMADALDLSDEKALAVARVLKQADEKRDDLRDKRGELEDRIREALKQSKPDEAALTKLIDQSVELHKQQERVADDAFTALKKILTVDQQARLVLLRSRLRHEFGHPMHDGPGFREHGPGHGDGPRHHDGGPEAGPGPGQPPPAPAEDEEG